MYKSAIPLAHALAPSSNLLLRAMPLFANLIPKLIGGVCQNRPRDNDAPNLKKDRDFLVKQVENAHQII